MLILAIVLFVIVFAIVLSCVAVGFGYFRRQQKQQIRSMLRKAEESPAEQRESTFMRAPDAEDALTKFLGRFEFADKLELFIEQSGSNWTLSKLIMTSAVTCSLGLFLGSRIHSFATPQICGLSCGAILGCVPFFLLQRKRKKTLRDFEKQFPDALDFLSRSMRAGHAFSVAMEMLAAESPEPLGGAFRRISNDLALGSSLETAFGKLMATVPSVDVQFFVSSVMLQQETGGNLGEILTKLAFIIRERFRLKGQVQAVSAHGRITGLVLLFMPIAVVALLSISNPGYLGQLTTDETGRKMIYGAIGGQVVGFFVIKKIIDIKV